MFVQVNNNTTLESLDSTIRDTWFNYGRQPSDFTINNIQYERYPPIRWYKPNTMNVILKNILYPKMKFRYEYDTEGYVKLSLQVYETLHDDSILLDEVKILARNNQYLHNCARCNEIASLFCPVCCFTDRDEFSCKECAKQHNCYGPVMMPVLNTPLLFSTLQFSGDFID